MLSVCVHVRSHAEETEQKRYSSKQDPSDSTEEVVGEREWREDKEEEQGLKMVWGHENQGGRGAKSSSTVAVKGEVGVGSL